MITLTREEAHGLLAALGELNRLSIGKDAICLPAEIDTAMEMLEARLSAPKHWSDCAVHSEPAYPAGECDCGGVPQPEPEPVKLRRGDILRCIETNELCTVWATSTTGKTQVKWKANDFGSYTAEQIGDLFWVEPKPEPEPVAWNIKHNRPPLSSDNPHEVVAVIKREWQGMTDEQIKRYKPVCADLHSFRAGVRAVEAKLKEKNT
jgi:hypothetical protein